MKNTKFTKIAILALSVALLIGAAIGFSVNAEDAEPQYEIIARNVVYGETVPVVYAVNVEVGSADAANVKVAYYYEKDGKESWTNATALDTSDENNIYEKDGKQYITFATNGVVPKKLGDVIFATVYTGTAPADDAVWVEYSAAEYFYNRLYEDGFVNMEETDGDDYQKRLLYEAQLEYSTRAQLVLGYEEGETLVNAYNYAYTTNEYVQINGASSAFDVDTVTATYQNDETTLKLVGWTVTYEDSTTEYGPSDAIAVNSVTCIEPKLEAHTCADNNGDHFCDSCTEKISDCADSDSDGMCDTCKTYTFEYTTNGCVSLAQYSTEGNSTSRIYLYQTSVSTDAPTYPKFGCSGQLITDPEDASNLVLRWALNDGVKDDGTNYSTTTTVPDAGDGVTTVNTSTIKFAPSEVKEGGNIHILEMDFNLREFGKNANNYNSSPFRLYAYNSDGEVIGDFYKTSSSDSKYNGFVYIDQTNYIYDSAAKTYTLDTNDANAYHFGNHTGRTSNRTDASNLMMFDRNEWYRFRFVWDVSTNSIGFEVSFDDGKNWYLCTAYTTADAITEGEEIAYLGFQVDTIYRIGFDILLDDVTYKVVDTHTQATEYGKDSVEASYGK